MRRYRRRTVQQILADYRRRTEIGELVDREQFIAEHAELADELRRHFESQDNAATAVSLPVPQLAETQIRPIASSSAVCESTSGNGVDADEMPEIDDRYSIIQRLGQGAMGSVYLAHDTELDRKVALKVPKFTEAENPELMEQFYREARLAATLSHRNICAVHDIGQSDGTHFISMAYIEGTPLADFVDADRPLSEKQIAIIVRKLALALHHAHSRRVIHRDLKPANILIDDEFEPSIMDFGLARQIDTTLNVRPSQRGALDGSPAYMSPERVEGDCDANGPAVDIYSLGVILYELLAGQLPFQGSVSAVVAQILTKPPPRPSNSRPGVDRGLEEICLKMMAKRIGDRYESMNEVAQALDDFLNGPAKPSRAASGRHGSLARQRGGRLGGRKPERLRVRHVQESQIQQARTMSDQDVQAICQTARQCIEDHIYGQAVQLLEQVPPQDRSEEVYQILDQAVAIQDEINVLAGDMQDALSKNSFDGLKPTVDRLLELKPKHRQARQVAARLTRSGLFGGKRRFRKQLGGKPRNPLLVKAIKVAAITLLAGVAMTSAVAAIYLRFGTETVNVDVINPKPANAESKSTNNEADQVASGPQIGNH